MHSKTVACHMLPNQKKRFALSNTVYGNRTVAVSISPDGKYLLTRFWNNYAANRSRTYNELTDLQNRQSDTIEPQRRYDVDASKQQTVLYGAGRDRKRCHGTQSRYPARRGIAPGSSRGELRHGRPTKTTSSTTPKKKVPKRTVRSNASLTRPTAYPIRADAAFWLAIT